MTSSTRRLRARPCSVALATRLKKRTLRWLIPIHRWLGLFLSLILLLWFISGIVMMFEGYPRTSDAERMEWLSSVSLDKVSVTPGEALSEATREAAGPVRMNQPGDRPLIHLKTSDGDWRSLYADSGQPIAPLDEESAATRAESITGYPAEEAQRLSRPDQWTVSGRFDAHLPLWRITLDDERRRWVYLSENTGEMIHDTGFLRQQTEQLPQQCPPLGDAAGEWERGPSMARTADVAVRRHPLVPGTGN